MSPQLLFEQSLLQLHIPWINFGVQGYAHASLFEIWLTFTIMRVHWTYKVPTTPKRPSAKWDLFNLKKQKKKTQETTPQAAWQLSSDNIASGSGWWHQRNQSLPIPKKPCQRTARKSNPEPEGIYITLWISLATIIKYQIPLPISEMLMASRRVEIPRSAGLGILSPAAYFRRVSLAPSKSPRPSHGLWAMDASHGCQPWPVDPTTAHPLVVLMSAFIHLNCHFIYIYRCICGMLVCVILIHTINWYNGWAEALSVFPTSDRMQCSNSISVMAWCCSFS